MLNRRPVVVTGLLGLIGILCWFFPLFHIRALGGSDSNATDSKNASVKPGLNSRPRTLDDYAAKAMPVTQLWEAFAADSANAKKQFGQQSGIGGAVYFCVRGSGTVETIKRDRVVLSVLGTERRICLELGAVVDSTVREAVGVKASEFSNSQDFNALSSELNRQVEQNVIGPNRGLLKEGALVEFTGCGKVGSKSDLDPMCLVPIQLKVNR